MATEEKIPVSAEFPKELVMRLNLFCSENATNRSAFIRKAVEEKLDREEK